MNLLQAIVSENLARIEELLKDKKTNINYTDNHNFSSLHHAVRKKSVEAVKLLLTHKKIDVRIRSYEGYTALHLACKFSDTPLEIVEILLARDPSLVGIHNNEEESPLQDAVQSRRLDFVETLINHGANPNHKDLDGDNALHYAAGLADYQILDFLLEKSQIDPKARNLENLNALCVLLVRSFPVFENREVIFRCCCLLLEKCYDGIQIEEIFQPTILCAAYNSFMIDYFIHRFYKEDNSKYRVIEELERIPAVSEDREFRYYVYAFLHDRIKKTHLLEHPRLLEINETMMGRSLQILLMKALHSDADNELVKEALDHLSGIGFNLSKLSDQIGSDFLGSLSDKLVSLEVSKRLYRLFRYLSSNEFDMDLILTRFLETVLVQLDHTFCWRVVYLILPFLTKYFLKPLSIFYFNDQKSRLFLESLIHNYGDTLQNQSLQQLSRNKIRKILLKKSTTNCDFFRDLEELGSNLPKHLLSYLKFDETGKIFCD